MENKAIIHDIAVKRLAAKVVVDGLNKKLSVAKKELDELDGMILHEMNEAQLTLTRVEGFTISVNEQQFYSPTDWATFNEFAETHHCGHLYQRRLTQKAVEEAIGLFGEDEVPVEKFTKHVLSVRKVAAK